MTFVGAGIEPMFSEATKDFPNVLFVFVGIVGINENIVDVARDIDIQKVIEDVIHESLKSGWGIR